MPTFKNILSKIPFIKNIDFDDPKARKNVIFMLASILGVIVIVFSAINDFVPKDDKAAASDDIATQAKLEVPDGEDNDILGISSNTLAQEAANQSAYSRTGNLVSQMFEESEVYNKDIQDAPVAETGVEPNSPASITNAVEEKIKALGLDGSSAATDPPSSGRTNVYGQASQTRTPSSQASATATSQGSATTASSKPKSRGGRTSAHEALLAMGSDEPVVSSSTASSTVPTEKAATPAPITAPKSQKISSSLDDDWNSMGSLDDIDAPVSLDHPFRVMFLRDEKISNGQRVTLRLLEDMVIEGTTIPKNTHLSAVCSINERLSVNVKNIEINGRIYTLNLVGYDADGAQGLYCPRTTASQTAKTAVDGATQVTSSALQRAFSGLTSEVFRTGVGIFTNAQGETKITVTSGYEFFLVAQKD